MGVDARHVVLRNAPAFLTGADAFMDLDGSATTLAADAVRRCHDAAGGWAPDDVGLLVAVTNTQARLLPGLASELVAECRGMLSGSVAIANLQGMGCAGLPKALEVAGWYLLAHPDSRVLVVASEANSAYAPAVDGRVHLSFRELRDLPPGADWVAELARTGAMVQNFLFGDGAAALPLGREGAVSFGPFAHRTNLDPDDVDLVRIEGGGSAEPLLGKEGRPRFGLEPSLLGRGPVYVEQVVREVLDGPIGALDSVFLHTGSRRILDGCCDVLEVARGGAPVARSYSVLREYANLSSASLGFMLAAGPVGDGVMAGFGGGFTATALGVHTSNASRTKPNSAAIAASSRPNSSSE